MTSPAERLNASLDRAQSMPYRSGPVGRRDAHGMQAAVHLAANALPDPASWGTWIGASQAKTALTTAAEAYREGDHARAAAWLDHTLVVLDVNNIPADARSRELINQTRSINAERLAANHLPRAATGADAETRYKGALRSLAVQVAAYEDTAHDDHIW